MTNQVSPAVSNLNFMADQYLRFSQGAFTVTSLMTDIYTEAWTEFFLSPQTLINRNLKFLQEVTMPPDPAWQTDYREVSLPPPFSQIIKLLDFSKEEGPVDELIPTLILPPQAGHHSYIADYSVEQSQVQTLRKSGLSNIYCVEWLSATPATCRTTIENYVEALHFCLKQMGGKANLVGDCQGGWMATIFAALYPEMVNSLVLAGAPIDFQAGDGQIKQAINYIAQNYPDRGMSFYRSLVKMGGGVLDGRIQVNGFNLMQPSQLHERYLNLYRNINSPTAIKRFREMKNWYDFPQDIAGTFYLWIVEHLFRDNELITGNLVVQNQPVNLGRIDCPLFLIAGKEDHITPPAQVFALEEYVSTPASRISKQLIKAGHIGLFMSREALTNTWQIIGSQMTELSRV